MNDDDDGKSADAPMDDEYEDDDDETVIRRRTLQWVRRVVIGLNLCPFAEKPYREKNGLRVVTVRGGDKDDSRGELLRAVRAEMERLVLSVDPNKAGTTLVVCPDCYPADFERYLDVVADVEDLILAGSSSDSSNDDSFEGILQVPPFHPLFQFAGSTSADAPDNATNRAPYPTFHLLREADVTAAVQRLVPPGNAAAVWSRNVDLLQALSGALSESDFRAIVTGADSNSSNNSTSNTTSPTLRFTVRQMLRRFRIPMLRGSSNSSDDADEDSTNAKNETDGM